MLLIAGLGILLFVLLGLACAIRAARAFDRRVESLLHASDAQRTHAEKSLDQMTRRIAKLDAEIVPLHVVRRKPKPAAFAR